MKVDKAKVVRGCMWIALVIVAVYFVQMIYYLPTPRWHRGDIVCFRLNGKSAIVFSSYRYAYGVTYYLSSVDDNNRVYEVKVGESEVQECK